MRTTSVQSWVNAANIAVSVNSNAFQLLNVYGFAMVAVITGAPVGVLKLQGSCDAPQDILGIGVAPSNWADIPNTTQNITVATSVLYNLDAQYYNWVRLVYTATSGSGAISVNLIAKGS